MAYGLRESIELDATGMGVGLLHPDNPFGEPQTPQVGLYQDPANNNMPDSAIKASAPLTLTGYSKGLWTKNDLNGQPIAMDNITGLFDVNGNSLGTQGLAANATNANALGTTIDVLGNPLGNLANSVKGPASVDALGNTTGNSIELAEVERRIRLEEAARQLVKQDFHDDKNPEASHIVAKIVKEDVADGNSVSTLKLSSDVAALATLTGASLTKLGVMAEDVPPVEYVGMGIPRADRVTQATQGAYEMAMAVKAQANEASLPPLPSHG